MIDTSHIKIIEFATFLHDAPVGSRVTYARGRDFAGDCMRSVTLKEIRRMAWEGPCYLVQRRLPGLSHNDAAVYEYIAIKESARFRRLRPHSSIYSVGADGEELKGVENS